MPGVRHVFAVVFAGVAHHRAGRQQDTACVPDADAVAKVADALSAATRPVLCAGGGVASAGNCTLVALAESLSAPFVSTIEGRGSILRTTVRKNRHQGHKPAAAFRPRWRSSSRSASSTRPWPRARSTAASHSRT
jgi:hypothetical protein